MKLLGHSKILTTLAKSLKKPCMMIYMVTEDNEITEILKAAPYLETEDNGYQVIADGFGILVFESEKTMERYYKLTVGDDGPTELNEYKGPARVYALTCNAKGELLHENT
jgi:hypothetical protein